MVHARGAGLHGADQQEVRKGTGGVAVGTPQERPLRRRCWCHHSRSSNLALQLSCGVLGHGSRGSDVDVIEAGRGPGADHLHARTFIVRTGRDPPAHRPAGRPPADQPVAHRRRRDRSARSTTSGPTPTCPCASTPRAPRCAAGRWTRAWSSRAVPPSSWWPRWSPAPPSASRSGPPEVFDGLQRGLRVAIDFHGVVLRITEVGDGRARADGRAGRCARLQQGRGASIPRCRSCRCPRRTSRPSSIGRRLGISHYALSFASSAEAVAPDPGADPGARPHHRQDREHRAACSTWTRSSRPATPS